MIDSGVNGKRVTFRAESCFFLGNYRYLNGMGEGGGKPGGVVNGRNWASYGRFLPYCLLRTYSTYWEEVQVVL
jgi:hypothetical protein